MTRSNQQVVMKKANGKTQTEMRGLDLEHELPPADGDDRPSEAAPSVAAPEEASGPAAELQKLKAERDSLLDRFARTQDQIEYARLRAAKEQQDFRDYAAADAIKALLPVIDSFERALQVKSEPGDFRNGVDIIYKQLRELWTNRGVGAIPAKGEPFDPRFHEAIEMVETNEAPDHHVLEELQRGYKVKDRLPRPSMGKVT